MSQVVELRFFGGLSVQETADVLNVSPETVMRDWQTGRPGSFESSVTRNRRQSVLVSDSRTFGDVSQLAICTILGASQVYDFKDGEMSEWFKEHAWKACVGETLPRVRIPLSPPPNLFYRDEFAISVDPVATMLPRLGTTAGDSSSRIALSIAVGLRCI